MANINKIRLSGQTYDIQDQNAQPLLTAGQGITIENNVISATGGGGSSYTAGRGIDITNDTISVSLPISAGTGTDSIVEGSGTIASGDYSHAEGYYTTAGGYYSHAEGFNTTARNYSHTEGYNTTASGNYSHAEGNSTIASGNSSHAEGSGTTAGGEYSHAEGSGATANGISSHAEGRATTAGGSCSHAEGSGTTASGLYSHAEGMATSASSSSSHAEGYLTQANGSRSHAEGQNAIANGSRSHAEGYVTQANNQSEHASGQYNVSSSASTTFGDSGNTLFSVGNGTASNARHNAFEIRQNGDIYLTKDGQDVKLQDQLGGGGGGITSGEVQTMIDNSLSGYVTTDTEQNITAQKTFVGDPNNSKKSIKFKQYNNESKVGFVVVNSASTNNELAAFELRPDTYTDSSSVSHPLLYLGHYRNNGIATAGVPQTMVGFRQYDYGAGAAYHYLMPLPAEAKTPFSLTTTFKNYFAPLGFKNGSTMITTDNTGVADFSDVLGGLKLVKLTQAEYDALSPNYDSNALYVIVN